MLTLRELRRATGALDAARRGARLERVAMPAPDELVLELAGGPERKGGDRERVLLSCRPGFARLAACRDRRPALPRPPGFAQYLKAHLVGGRLTGAGLRGEDRIASLRFETREGRLELLLQIMGPRSNLYLLDARELVVAAVRPLAETRRELALGEPWRDPPSAAPKEGEDRFAEMADDDLLAAIERTYGEAMADEGEARLARRLKKALDKARAGLLRKRARIERDAAAGDEAPHLERLGELLKGSLRDVRPKADSVDARDFETGEVVPVPLDPGKSASENLEDYFRRARRAARKGLKAAQEMGALDVRIEELDALRRELDAAEGTEALEALAARPEVERLLDRYAPGVPGVPGAAVSAPAAPKRVWRIGKRELPTRLVPKRYRTRDDLEVWVGKNDEGNDVLTMRLARGNDLFFHLEGSPGSHVILRTEGSTDPPQESLLDAAELAVHFSKQRGSSRAAVHVAACKDISKPSGAKHGLVYVHRGRTLKLRHSPERLRRVLEARLDD